MVAQILFGILFIAFGIACVKWNYKVADMLREFDSLSKFGDVYSSTKVLGVLCILLGITIALGLWQGLLGWFFSIFFGQLQ